jgi:mannose-6-phosphate isomerase-like protein (cupin superfamily)
MMSVTMLKKRNVSRLAARLDRPFSMINVTNVGDILVSVYICQGVLDWHKHVDIDELFWVYEGTILLESDWGKVRLRAGELAVVPKGVRHRSSSRLRASVLLLRCGFMAGRKNGRRRLYSIAGESQLERITLHSVTQAVAAPFRFQVVAQVEDSVVQTAWGEGTWSIQVPAPRDLMLFVLNGTATARTLHSMLHMHPGEFTVIPQGAVYQLSTTAGTQLVRVTQEDLSSGPIPRG